MRVRSYKPSDAAQLDRLFELNRNGDVRLDRDAIVVAESEGVLAGALAFRPVCLVHELRLDPGPMARHAAHRLGAYAIGAARAQGYREAIFLVSGTNDRMRRFAEEMGAVPGESGEFLALPLE